MMDLPNLTILDVGHGNCSILRDVKGTIVFDAGTGDTLLEFLECSKVKEINSVLISHADDDHIGGLLTLYLNENIVPKNVYLNPDPKRTTKLWRELRSAVKYARKNKGTITNTHLTTSLSGKLNCGKVYIEVLAPSPEIAMSGIGGQDLNNRNITPHSMSAVVRLKKDDLPVVFLPGDLDAHGLENMCIETSSFHAKVLIFPHHGGLSKSLDIVQFTKNLCSLVKPRCVIFSIGRSKYENPRHEIIETVRKTVPNGRIVCTQMSENCAPNIPNVEPDHLNTLPAEGHCSRICCAGTIVVDLGEGDIRISPDESSHKRFIVKAAPNPLCLKK